ncbi:ImmA/IrrE family metallo-endopeptidase [Burkholderia cepacia]|uniref:ImmA/IrrE family metallo-endopeptidase n=1 Tax=Burkholderia cepacia TaxID=292 RepID=UPI002AB67012|nr:ImmA/IrrE family metallo-endopeptidase [Burkholderia cepacia]
MATSPAKVANQLSQVLDTFHAAHGGMRYPVDVEMLALGCADIFKFPDPIAAVQAASIPGFEGGLFRQDNSWLLLYNDGLSSPGRIRFTQAHELGHYFLHRAAREVFECTAGDMDDWSADQKAVELEADKFAAYLLMPLHDFRAQVPATVDINVLSDCAERYGVSLTAAILQWLSCTEEKAILVRSREGYMLSANASEAAYHAGAYFRTAKETIEVPSGSLAAKPEISNEKQGALVPTNIWFPYASPSSRLREMKITSDSYDTVLTLLILPRTEDVRKPAR